MNLRPSALVAAMFLISLPISAEESDNANNDAGNGRAIEEMIVTATFRDTKLIDTPISISAIDGQTLQDKGIFNLEDLYTSLPSVSFSTNGNTYNNISIRGLTAPTSGAGATVGIYVDNIPVTDSFDGTSVSGIIGVDLARVEALKGPQGTLYGEGALGGAIRYITNDADPNNWEFKVDTGLETNKESDDLSKRGTVVLNIPLIDNTLGIRVAGYFNDTAGFIDALAPRNEDDVDDAQESGGRIKVNWIPNDWMSAEATYNYSESTYGGPPNADFAFGTSLLTDPAQPNGGRTQNEQANVTLEMQFADKVEVTTSLSYYKREIDLREQISPRFASQIQPITNCFAAQFGLLQPPLTPSPIPGIDDFTFCLIAPAFGFPSPYALDAVTTSIGGSAVLNRKEERGVAELRAVSIDPDSRLQWVAGLYAKRGFGVQGLNTPSSIDYNVRPGFEALLPIFGAFSGASTENQTDLDEIAAYGDVVYSLTDTFDVSLGLRLSRVTKETDGVGTKVEDDKLSPKVGFAWRPQDGTLVYGTVQRGYRPGFFNQALVTHNEQLAAIIAAGPPFLALTNIFTTPGADQNGDGTVDEVDAQLYLDATSGFVQQEGDEVNSFELGIKTRLWDDRMTVIGALYYNDWKNTYLLLSESQLLAAAFGDLMYTTSGGQAHTRGLELDVVANVTDRLTLSLGGDYIDEAELDKVPGRAAGQFTDALGNPVFIREGNRLADAPDFRVNIGLAYDMPLPRGMTGTFAIDYYRIDKMFTEATNETVTPAYGKFDARFTAYTNDRQWRFSLYAKNLTDETIIFERNESGIQFGRPRSIGLEVSYNTGN